MWNSVKTFLLKRLLPFLVANFRYKIQKKETENGIAILAHVEIVGTPVFHKVFYFGNENNEQFDISNAPDILQVPKNALPEIHNSNLTVNVKAREL